MRVTFIRPHLTDRRSADAMEPLVFAILAGLTPPGIELDFFDERLEPIPEQHCTDLVALTVETYTARRAYQIATKFRQRGIPVVMGGYHPTFLPEEAMTYADAVVVGDGEGAWERILADAQKGTLERVYRQPQPPSLEGLVFDRSIFRGKRYKPIVPVQYSRGCQFDCDFCSIHAFHGSQTRQRPVPEVVAEIRALNRKHVMFVDSNLFANVARTKELFRALIPLNIRWGGQVTINAAWDTEFLELMAKSGCFAVAIGFESLEAENQEQMKKLRNLKHRDFSRAVQAFREKGIMIYACFVFGNDHDTVDVFDVTARFAIQSKFTLVNFLALAPTPGSRLYNRLMQENRLIFKRWWIDPDYRYGQATFHPMRMTADELTEGCLRARSTFYRRQSVLKRALDPAANSRTFYHLGFHLIANTITRHELAYKLGHRLGSDTPLEPPLEKQSLRLASSPGPEVKGAEKT